MHYDLFFYQLFGYSFDAIFEAFTSSDSSEDSFSELEFGKYIIFVTGLDANGAPTGKYAFKEFEKESPYKASYEDYLGDYTFTNAAGVEEYWTLKEKVYGESYTLEGVGGVTDEIIAAFGGQLAEATYQYGMVYISNQELGTWTDEDGQTIQDKFVAIWYYGPDYYSNEEYMSNPTILTFGLNDNGKLDLSIKSDSWGELEGFAYIGEIDDYSYYAIGDAVKFDKAQLTKGIVENTTAYEDFLGQWSVKRTVWTIAEAVSGESYTITGLCGSDFAVEGFFENGLLLVSEQDVEASNGYDNYLSGIFSYYGSNYSNYPFGDASLLFKGKINEDGNIDLIPGACSYGTFNGLVFYSENPDDEDDYLFSAGFALPNTLEPYDPSTEVSPLQYAYGMDDIVPTTMAALTGTQWDVYGIPGDGDSEWYIDERDYLGPATVTDIDDANGEDLFTISGLSYVCGELYGFDDSVLFDLYNGYLFSHVTYNGSFDYEGQELFVKTEYYDADFNAYSDDDYLLVGGKVDNGIIALVYYDYYDDGLGIDGLGFSCYTDEECTELFSPIWAVRSVILVDPAVYPTPQDVHKALRKAGLNKQTITRKLASARNRTKMAAQYSTARPERIVLKKATRPAAPTATASTGNAPAHEYYKTPAQRKF